MILIEKDKVVEALHQWEQDYTWDDYDAKYSPSVVSPSDVIDGLPTIEIVRCRECKRWSEVSDPNVDYGLCERWGRLITTRGTYFCKDGKRRGDDDTRAFGED